MNARPLVIVTDTTPLSPLEISGAASTQRGCALGASDTDEAPPTSRLEPDYAAALLSFWYGHRRLKISADLEHCWKAVKAMAAADGILSDPERLALVGKMCATGVPPSVVDAVMRWDERGAKPAEVIAAVVCTEDARAELAAWVVYEGISAALADAELAMEEIESFHALAASLRVAPSTVDALVALCCREASLRVQRCALLRADLGAVLRSLWDERDAEPQL